MKRIILAASLVFCATTPFAQVTDLPKPKCEPKPEYPGRLAMRSDTRRGLFDREVKVYQKCMTTYIDERNAAMKQNEQSANDAVAEYNAVMKKLNADQEAAKD